MATILVIDDEPMIIEMLTGVLEDEGHTVYSAYGGSDGLRLAREVQPDLVLSDIIMQDVRGDVLCRTLVDQGWRKPIILMSANQSLADASQCGHAAFLPKPFELDKLLLVINQGLAPQNAA